MSKITRVTSNLLASDTPFVSFPSDAISLALGDEILEWGADRDIAISNRQVIVRFPVSGRDGSIKQTTGLEDTFYKWKGIMMIASDDTPDADVFQRADALKKVLLSGMPVFFYYANQRKKVLIETFDYNVFNKCYLEYEIACVEFQPQKIKKIPVRYDTIVPERWGVKPKPGDGQDDNFDVKKCNCTMSVSTSDNGTGYNKSIAQFLRDYSGDAGVNPTLPPAIAALVQESFWKFLGIEKKANAASFINALTQLIMLQIRLKMRDQGQDEMFRCFLSMITHPSCEQFTSNFFNEHLFQWLTEKVIIHSEMFTGTDPFVNAIFPFSKVKDNYVSKDMVTITQLYKEKQQQFQDLFLRAYEYKKTCAQHILPGDSEATAADIKRLCNELKELQRRWAYLNRVLYGLFGKYAPNIKITENNISFDSAMADPSGTFVFVPNVNDVEFSDECYAFCKHIGYEVQKPE